MKAVNSVAVEVLNAARPAVRGRLSRGRSIAAIVSACFAMTLSGCSGPPATPGTAASGPSQTPSLASASEPASSAPNLTGSPAPDSAMPTSPESIGPTDSQPVIRQIGEPFRVLPPAGEVQESSLTVTITSVQPGIKCTTGNPFPSRNGGYLGVMVDITADSQGHGSTLVSASFAVRKPDGSYVQLPYYPVRVNCIDQSYLLHFPFVLRPGQHVTGYYVELDTGLTHGTLEWFLLPSGALTHTIISTPF
ncbi:MULTISPECIES: hypothetical protein [Arthrobacter]|uniref:Lipoprotein n=2 Tax=Arthrobacter TaxID=1663 RepID=A0ABU9KG37_9MICC|nr:hypothetical protein [Arthrobacter sp. YJM1]MDP5225849.1 hypothetical protein [Arthrobacter sp. YJM1]